MPLKKGSSRATVASNISEFHHGPTFAKTKKKFGKAKADKQAVAVVMSEARKTGSSSRGDFTKLLGS